MKTDFNAMTKTELRAYLIAHPNEQEAFYIRRMAEKAKSRGIEFYRPEVPLKPIDNKSDRPLL
jgi:hypothetical protein